MLILKGYSRVLGVFRFRLLDGSVGSLGKEFVSETYSSPLLRKHGGYVGLRKRGIMPSEFFWIE